MKLNPYSLLLFTLLIAFNSCDTVKYLAMTDGSKSDGILQFQYDVGGFEKPIVQWDSALNEAKQTCQRWGYSSAEWFGSGTSICIGRNEYGCVRWRYTYKCMCTD